MVQVAPHTLNLGSIVDLEVNNEMAGLDILLQHALISLCDGVAPCPGAVVGTVRIRRAAAMIEGELKSCVRNLFHSACVRNTSGIGYHGVLV